MKPLPITAIGLAALSGCTLQHQKPNILLAIADDWSWPHASIKGVPEIQTPAFDRLAHEGVMFENAFCSSPSCTPSRGAVLTGQYHWRLQEGGNLWSDLPAGIPVYPDLLEEAGYFVGYTGKGWGPGNYRQGGRTRNPAGPVFNERKMKSPKGISNVDYAANFRDFLRQKPKNTPFCFWYGGHEPHRSYQYGRGESLGKDPAAVTVPPLFPDLDTVHTDLLDYYAEVEWFDQHLNRMLKLLDSLHVTDQTLIICTSDNGMPFPAAKSNLYESGIHMPLAIRWGRRIRSGRTTTELVSLTDLAPTILEAAGIPIPQEMTGISLMPILKNRNTEPLRTFVLAGKERHAWVRKYGLGYPTRSLRTSDYLLIYNFYPERWPAGDPDYVPGINFRLNYGDIDNSPTKQVMYDHRDDPKARKEFIHAFLKHPQIELFDVQKDPGNFNNLAVDPEYKPMTDSLLNLLFAELKRTKDPRMTREGEIFDLYPYFGRSRPMSIPDSSIFHAQGEMAGEPSSYSIILQTRLTASPGAINGEVPGKKGIARIIIDTDSTFGTPAYTHWKIAWSDNDYYIRWKIDTLSQNTRYYYRLEYGMHVNFAKKGAVRSFKTLPGQSSGTAVNFVVVTGMNYAKFHYGPNGTPDFTKPGAYTGTDKQLGYPALQSILKLHPDFFIGTGDNVYYDHPSGKWAATDSTSMRKKWHEQFVQPRFIALFSSTPTYWEKDDHDFRYNDCDTTGDRLPGNVLGKRIFLEQMPFIEDETTPHPTYRTRRINRDLQIWMTEGRDYRSPNKSPDGPGKSIWGKEQLQWLEQTLKSSDATYKILISPTPLVGPDDNYKSDNHVNPKGFRTEGDTFFKWLAGNGITPDRFFIVCGDRHWQYHARHPSGYEEFSCGALVDANSRPGRIAGDPKSTDPDALIKQFYVQGKGQASGGFLEIRQFSTGGKPELKFNFYDEHGTLQYSTEKRIKFVD